LKEDVVMRYMKKEIPLQKQRNILVILCDQLRPDFLRSYGCDAIPTPNIDNLAAKGVVFERAITQSTVCAPARACMMTGRYVSDHKVWTNVIPFRDGMDFIAERMNKLGYHTGCFGKMHHNPSDDVKGFQTAFMMEENRLGENEPYLQWLQERHPEITSVFNYDSENMVSLLSQDEYYEHWITDRAMDFMAPESKQNKPFFAWVSYQGPHVPYDPPAEVKGLTDSSRLPELILDKCPRDCQVIEYREALYPTRLDPEGNRRIRAAYADNLAAIDMEIGRIIDKLKTQNLLESTTIIFSADHGDLLGDHELDMKGPFPYSSQLNIPMILSNHPDITAGTRSSALVGNIDIPGTVLAIANDKNGIGASRSLFDTVLNKNIRQVIYSEFNQTSKTVETEQYRLTYYPFLGTKMLFDRHNDPNELHNLAGLPKYQVILTELMGHIVDFMILAGGFCVEGCDFVPELQDGVRLKDPLFARDFPLAIPLNERHKDLLRKKQLNTQYYDQIVREKAAFASAR
jgi:arylsulfatase